jgi:hypothetical protein
MNKLFQTLRGIRPREEEAQSEAEALPGFDNRIQVLMKYAERAAGYEDELSVNLGQVLEQLAQLQYMMEIAIDEGKDRDALEYLRLAVRLRPQRDLLDREIQAFTAVAEELLGRVQLLLDNLDEAHRFAQDGSANPVATHYLDQFMTRLTRYFVMLEKVALARHKDLRKRLAEQMMHVIDDRQLDLEMARFILSRRRALGSGG